MTRRTAFIGAELFDGARRRRDAAVLVEDGRRRAIVEPGQLPEDGAMRSCSTAACWRPASSICRSMAAAARCSTAPRRSTASAPSARPCPLRHDRAAADADHRHAGCHRGGDRAVRDAIAAGVPGCLGIHIEGPHLSVARKGAHDPALIRPMDEADFERLTSTGHRPCADHGRGRDRAAGADRPARRSRHPCRDRPFRRVLRDGLGGLFGRRARHRRISSTP